MKSLSNLEMEKIVQAVRENPCVWDTSCPQYRLTVNTDKVYQEIGNDLNKPPEEVLKCWEALRMKYSREKRKGKEEMPRSGSSGGVRKKYNTKDWELLPYMRFLDKTLERRPVFEQLDVPLNISSSIQMVPSQIDLNVPATSLEENSQNSIPQPSSVDDVQVAEEIPSSIGGKPGNFLFTFHSIPLYFFKVGRQSVHLEYHKDVLLNPNESRKQHTTSSHNLMPATSSRNTSPNQQKRPLGNEFPIAKKKARTEAKTYEDERRSFITKISDILTTSQTPPTGQPRNTEERMAHSYADYVKMRFLNWSKEKMIEGFALLNETIEKIEKINK